MYAWQLLTVKMYDMHDYGNTQLHLTTLNRYTLDSINNTKRVIPY